jgi:DNA mismatch endonuclease (patch repair protein)
VTSGYLFERAKVNRMLKPTLPGKPPRNTSATTLRGIETVTELSQALTQAGDGNSRPAAGPRSLSVAPASAARRYGPITVPERWRQPFASSESVRLRMSTQARQDTGPEVALRRALHALGLRYRLHRAPLPNLRRKADIVFGPARVAVFVDGCFWHGCPEHGARHHDVNGWYWPEKIARNRRRDENTDRVLASAGWLAVRIWEHDIVGGELALAGAAARVREAVQSRQPRASSAPGKAGSLPR